MADESILTSEECTEVISALIKTDFKLINYTIKPISDNVNGYTGQHLRAKCEIEENGKEKIVKFFIKKKIEDESSVLSQVEHLVDVFKNEAVVLKFLNEANENATWLPKLLKYRHPNLVILEDLGEREYEMAKVEFALFDLDHCKCILKSLAQLHGFSLNYVRQSKKYLADTLDIFIDSINDQNTNFGAAWVKAGVDTTVYLINETPLPQKCSKTQIIENYESYIETYCKGLQPSNSKYETLSHGDLWGNNLMFKYEKGVPIDCCLIDFQVMRCIPFTQDVLFAIYVNTIKDFREKHFKDLLEYYYETLCKVLATKYGLDPEEVIPKKDYYMLLEERKKSVLILSAWYKSFLYMDRAVFSEAMQNEGQELIMGNRVKFVKKQLEDNEQYKRMIYDELQDLIEAFK